MLLGKLLKMPLKTAALRIAVPLALIIALPAQADQDEILLKNGSRILGTVIDARDGAITIETGFAGTLSVALDQVDSVRSASEAVIMLEDDIVLRGVPLNIQNGELVAPGGDRVPVQAVQVVNPAAWELGEGYLWKGYANAALVLQRGNTESDELNYKFESVWRSVRDRYTLRAGGENDENNGEQTAENWQIAAKYDYFLEGPNYVGVQAFAEQDNFADLDMRVLVGPYVGRQFFSEPIFTMSAEAGVSFVDEDFIVAEDRDYVAGNWQLNATSNYLGGDNRLYLDQIGVWNLQETSDVIINTTLGVAIPFLWRLEAAAEVQLDYDSGAVGDVDELDQTYRFRLGYTW